MKIGIFYSSISNPNKFSNKRELMDNFKMGVENSKDEPICYHDQSLDVKNLDAGFILGYTLQKNYRYMVIDSLSKNNSYRIFADSNILHYANPSHEWHRYSLNAVYPTTGTYFFGELDKSKWDTYSKFHNVELKPYRTTGNHIVIFCQRPNGWNLFGNNQERWLDKTITKLRKHTHRPIVIRMHPGDGKRFTQIEILKKRYDSSITVSENPHILQDLKDCWCTVGYNSTPNVVSLIEGVPSIITDPANSWSNGISGSMLNTIERPYMPDREEWIHRIANIHWSNDEVRSGKLWSHIRDYILSVQK
jgi:hypothetical protein